MRDANGSGDIYFDELFINGTIKDSIIFYSFHGIISLFNLITVPFICYAASLNRCHHRNLRIVSLNLYIAFFLCALGNFAYTILVLCRISDIIYEFYFEFFRFVASLGPGIWKATFLAIVFERIAATIFYKNYEHRAPIILGIGLFLLGFLGAVIPFIYFIARVPMSLNILIIMCTDVISVIAMFILNWSNRTMLKLKIDSRIDLTHRYQISENLRVIQIMIPIIFTGAAFDIAAAISLFLITKIDFNAQLLFPCYLFITNLYIPFAFLLYLYKDTRVRQMLMCIIFRNNKVLSEECLLLRNIHGKPLIIEDSPENHFKNLKNYWQ